MNILSASEIRAELARRKISKARLARETGIYYQYLVEALQGYRPATKVRATITRYLQVEAASSRLPGNAGVSPARSSAVSADESSPDEAGSCRLPSRPLDPSTSRLPEGQ
jgi:lambda repressor-like predicted transcriptional regulator